MNSLYNTYDHTISYKSYFATLYIYIYIYFFFERATLYLDIHNSIIFFSHIFFYNYILFKGKAIKGCSSISVSENSSITKVDVIV